MWVSEASPATSGVAPTRVPAGLPEDSCGAYNESSCCRKTSHNALENYVQTTSVVAGLV